MPIKTINNPLFQATTSTGAPLSGGKLYTYKAGTSTLKATYSDIELSTANANPIILDSLGQAKIYGHGAYKFNLTTSGDVQVTGYPVDNITAEDGGDVTYTSISDYGGDLAAALTDIGSTDTTLVINQTVTLSASATVPSNVTLHFTKGGSIDGAYTLTTNGMLTGDVNLGSSLTLAGTPLNDRYYATWAGAATATADNTTAIQAILDWVPEGATFVLPPGNWAVQGLIIRTDHLNIECLGSFEPVDETDTTAVIEIGEDGDTAEVNELRGNLRVENDNSYNDGTTVCVGVEILGLTNSGGFEFSLITGCKTGIHCNPPLTNAISYNTFVIGALRDNLINLHIDPAETTGYCNDCLWIGGRYVHSGDTGAWNIKISADGGRDPNTHVFLKPIFENGTGLIYCAGNNNKWKDARFEFTGVATDTLIHFTSTGDGNEVSGNYLNIKAGDSWVEDIGAGTLVDSSSFTVVGDYSDRIFNGMPIVATMDGTAEIVNVVRASYSDPLTTIYTYQPIITHSPTAVEVPYIENYGDRNTFQFRIDPNGVVNFSFYEINRHKIYHACPHIISGPADYPALTLAPTGSSANEVLRVVDLNGDVNFEITGNGVTTIGEGGASITKHLSEEAVLNFDLTSVTTQDLAVTVTGATAGDTVALGVPNGAVTTDTVYFAWVSASHTVTVRAMALATGVNPSSGTFSVDVWKHSY
jgi:hypothetical protein